MNLDWMTSVISSTLRMSVPLVLAVLGGLYCERVGVVNLALEGMMLVGAFSAAVVAHFTQSAWAGAMAGAMAGMLIAAFYGLTVIRLHSEQVVAGTAINLLAIGITPFLCKVVFGVTGSTPGLSLDARFVSAPMWIALAGVLLAWGIMKFLPLGLWIEFAGEHPEALEAAGIRVKRIRWTGVLMSGFWAGLGGAALSIFLSSSFSKNMTAGRGYIALAALILGKWKPVPAALACVLFGFTDAIQIRLQGIEWFGGQTVPVQFIQILPYVITLFVLAGFVGRSRPPKALGIPWK